jgi:hypothetical protein
MPLSGGDADKAGNRYELCHSLSLGGSARTREPPFLSTYERQRRG